MPNISPESIKPGTLRRRKRAAKLAAGYEPPGAQHGNPYWARNWGCGCSTCKPALRKLNHEQYIARKARKLNRTEGDTK